MTGAELRAWRERLGKDEAWIHEILDAVDVASGSHNGNGSTRRLMVELGHHEGSYDVHEREALRTAYRAALEADEARQAAERGPVEPVCPEGVKTWAGCGDGAGSANLTMAGQGFASLVVAADGSIRTGQYAPGVPVSPALLEYAAALSRYRASVHADSDKRRKLDAVRAAEAAQAKAIRAERDAVNAAMEAARGEREATTAREVADRAVDAARREAGL